MPLLAVWGKNDLIFIHPGAAAFSPDLPDAEIHLLDGGPSCWKATSGRPVH